MISVSIAINAEAIYARTATRQVIRTDGKTLYHLDDGSSLLHNAEDGAVALAIAMLRTIKEAKRKEFGK